MVPYSKDRKESDEIHPLLVELIYKPNGYEEYSIDPEEAKRRDISEGIDYYFEKNGEKITSAERCRNYKYQSYNDFTIRFERPDNPNKSRMLSEHYKSKADINVYAISNEDKSSFVKWVIVDNKVKNDLIQMGKIVVDQEIKAKTSVVKDGVIHCPVFKNTDYSSDFYPIDVGQLYDLSEGKAIICCFGNWGINLEA